MERKPVDEKETETVLLWENSKNITRPSKWMVLKTLSTQILNVKVELVLLRNI